MPLQSYYVIMDFTTTMYINDTLTIKMKMNAFLLKYTLVVQIDIPEFSSKFCDLRIQAISLLSICRIYFDTPERWNFLI